MRLHGGHQAKRHRGKVILLSGLVVLLGISLRMGRSVFALAGRIHPAVAHTGWAFDGPAGPPVATLGTNLAVLENTHLIIKLDGFDPNPGAVLTAFIIYISDAGTLFQVNPDGTRGAPIGNVTPEFGTAAQNSNLLVWYEPNQDLFGQDSFQYYLKDNLGGESFLKTVTINVNKVGQAPAAFSVTHTSPAVEGNLDGIVLNWTDPDLFAIVTGHVTQFPDSGRLYRAIQTTTANQITPANPTFLGTQLYYVSNDFPNSSSDAFSYYVTDGTLSSQQVTDYIVLQATDLPPTTGVTPSIFATTENKPVQIILTPVDPSGPTSSLQVELTGGPQNGSLCQLNLINECQLAIPGNDLIGPQPDGKSWALTYTPNEGFTSDGGSPDTFTYTLTSAEGITSGPFTAQVYVVGITSPLGCSAISITPSVVPGGNLNTAYPPVTFAASGGEMPYKLTEIGALPAGLSFSGGVLSGTPTQAGNFSCVVIATDANNCAATTAYEFSILNPPPGITAGGPLSVVANDTAAFMRVATVSDSALSLANLSVQVASAPAGVNVAGLTNTNGTISAYVGASCGTAPGPYTVVLQVSDGVTTEMTNLTVNVTSPLSPNLTLTYPAQVTLNEEQTAMVSPKTALTTGLIVRAVAINNGPGGFNGTISVNSSGVVTLASVGPSGGTFTVDVSVLFPCGITKDVSFTFVVACAADDFSLSALNESFPKAGGIGTVAVVDSANCSWSAVSNAAWITVTGITLTGGPTGNSDGTVSYSVAPTKTLRTGTMMIAGQTFTVSQACPAPTITASPVSLMACLGSPAAFSVTASGTNLTYQWRKNGSAIAGAHLQTLSIGSVAPTDAAQYDVVVTADCGSVTSSAATLSIDSPVIALSPANQAAIVGGSATFSVSVRSSIAYAVQWQSGGGNGGFTNIPGATSNQLTLSSITAAQSGTTYRAVITSACGTVTSGAATLSVISPSGA